MSLLVWKEAYSVNVNEFDIHHQQLFSLINELYKYVDCKDKNEKQLSIGKALTELIDYSCYHFDAEEKLMLAYDYPQYLSHKEEHDQFKQDIAKLMGQHKDGTLIWSFPIFNFLKDWLIFHVLNTDKLYEPYLNVLRK